jgi:hypothetical protein
MASTRNIVGGETATGNERGRVLTMRDEEKAKEDDSPSAKRAKFERFPLTRWELAAALGVFFVFSTGLFCIYLTMPAAEYGKLKLPRTISDLRLLKYALLFYSLLISIFFVLFFIAQICMGFNFFSFLGLFGYICALIV